MSQVHALSKIRILGVWHVTKREYMLLAHTGIDEQFHGKIGLVKKNTLDIKVIDIIWYLYSQHN
jgi:hypothetical protein